MAHAQHNLQPWRSNEEFYPRPRPGKGDTNYQTSSDCWMRRGTRPYSRSSCCAVCANVVNNQTNFQSCQQPKQQGHIFCEYHLKCDERTKAYTSQKEKLDEFKFKPLEEATAENFVKNFLKWLSANMKNIFKKTQKQ